jgi:hypothetical protein
MSELRTANLALRTATLRVNRLLDRPTLDIPATLMALGEVVAALGVMRRVYREG